jgi:hypothetical protein
VGLCAYLSTLGVSASDYQNTLCTHGTLGAMANFDESSKNGESVSKFWESTIATEQVAPTSTQ